MLGSVLNFLAAFSFLVFWSILRQDIANIYLSITSSVHQRDTHSFVSGHAR